MAMDAFEEGGSLESVIYPATAGWVVSEDVDDPVGLLLSLP